MTNQIVYDVCKVIRADAGCPKGMRKVKGGGCAPAKAKQGGGWGKAALGAGLATAAGLGIAAVASRPGRRMIGQTQKGVGRAATAVGNFVANTGRSMQSSGQKRINNNKAPAPKSNRPPAVPSQYRTTPTPSAPERGGALAIRPKNGAPKNGALAIRPKNGAPKNGALAIRPKNGALARR